MFEWIVAQRRIWFILKWVSEMFIAQGVVQEKRHLEVQLEKVIGESYCCGFLS